MSFAKGRLLSLGLNVLIPGQLCRYNVYWYRVSLHRHEISKHGIDYGGWPGKMMNFKNHLYQNV